MRVECRTNCAACCIEPSISSPIPGMPAGKPAGIPCVQLDGELRCKLFGLPSRPKVCVRLQPSLDMCGQYAADARVRLRQLELLTAPDRGDDACRAAV